MARIKLRIQRPWIPYIILIVSLSLTILSTYYVSRATYTVDQLRFLNAVHDTQSSIQSRLETYFTLLQSGGGLFIVNPDPTREQFDSYINRLNLQKNYPGTMGLGYIQKVTNEEKDTFIQTIQTEENPQFSINPPGDRSIYYVIRFLDLRSSSTPTNIGYDMNTDPIRRAALQKAIDTGNPAISGKVTLHNVVNKNLPNAGFIIVAPIYANGAIPSSLSERRAKIDGFIYSPFQAENLLVGILGNKKLPQLLNYQIYNGTTINKKSLLYDSTGVNPHPNYQPRFYTPEHITLAGNTWTIIFSTHPQFENESQKNLSIFIFIGGILVSIGFFLLSRSQYIARTNAEIAADELQYSQKELQKAIGHRDNFISIASHELKTPVTSLRVYTEVLLKQFTKKGDNRTADYLARIIRQVDKLTMLIQDLLNVSRIQSNQLAFTIEKFDLNALTKEVIENTQQIANHHTIILKGKVTKKVWGDKERIGQVIINLLTNAFKYSPQSNKVIVQLQDSENNALLAVQDFGLGISKEHQKRIFDKFYRINDIHEKTFPGLGIGLFISQTIIKRHGGVITIQSKKGKGSIFSFTLPYDKKKIIFK